MQDKLKKLRSRDVSQLGYQARIAHQKQIDDLEKEMLNKDVERVLAKVGKERFDNSIERSEEYIKNFLQSVEELWLTVPHLRLGQLLGNCADSELKIYYMEDGKLLEKMTSLYVQPKAK